MIPAADLVAPSLIIGPRTFVWGARTYIMGVINCSPESFSGDGLRDADEALRLAHRMVDEGADILDIGGQSTRPGAEKTEAGFDEITPDEEIRRTVPVIERLRAELPDTPISIDTYKPEVAHAALRAGAHLINDITGFRRDPTLARIVAEAGVPAVVMHNQRGRRADDVIAGITEGLRESLTIAGDSGVPQERLIIDPGFGFGWKPEQNIEMLRRLGELRVLGLPLLIGTSRKSTIGAVLGGGSSRKIASSGHGGLGGALDRRRRRHRARARCCGDEAGRHWWPTRSCADRTA